MVVHDQEKLICCWTNKTSTTRYWQNLFIRQRPLKSKHQLLINVREKVGIEILKSNAFIGYSQTIDDVYENLEDYNPTKKRRVLTVFHDMIADLESNKNLSPGVTGLFLRGKKTQYFTCFYNTNSFQIA